MNEPEKNNPARPGAPAAIAIGVGIGVALGVALGWATGIAIGVALGGSLALAWRRNG